MPQMISSSSVRVRKVEAGPPVSQVGATNGRGVSPYQSVQEDSHEPNRFRSHRATGARVGCFLLRPTSQLAEGTACGVGGEYEIQFRGDPAQNRRAPRGTVSGHSDPSGSQKVARPQRDAGSDYFLPTKGGFCPGWGGRLRVV